MIKSEEVQFTWFIETQSKVNGTGKIRESEGWKKKKINKKYFKTKNELMFHFTSC